WRRGPPGARTRTGVTSRARRRDTSWPMAPAATAARSDGDGRAGEMRVNRWCSWAFAVALGLGLCTASEAAHAPVPAEAVRLNAEVDRLYHQAKYGEALPLAERALALEEAALGPGDINLAVPMVGLARLYLRKDDTARAEVLLLRVVGISEKALG